VYLHVKFLPDGQQEDPAQLLGPMLETTPEDDRRREGLYGEIKFIVKSGRDLADKDGWGTGVSDPYAVIKLPDGQEWSTQFKKDNLNPDWDEEHTFTVKINRDVFKIYSAIPPY
jgi:Ca2+-dependent lipid-binding protein